MSSILLSNPFVAPPSPTHSTGSDPQTALAVAPAIGVSGSGGAGDSNSYAGTGSGYGGGAGQQALLNETHGRGGALMERQADATPGSVVNAQAQSDTALPGHNLPKVEMPDPLPTSPILKRLSENS